MICTDTYVCIISYNQRHNRGIFICVLYKLIHICACVTLFLLLMMYKEFDWIEGSWTTTLTGKIESSRPGNAFLASVQNGVKSRRGTSILQKPRVCRLPIVHMYHMYHTLYLLVVHKLKSVFLSPHFLCFAVMNCNNCTNWFLLHCHYYYYYY